MQNNKFHYCLHILPILFFMAFVSASCIKDELGDCPAPGTPGFSLQVKAFDADGGSLGDETIKRIRRNNIINKKRPKTGCRMNRNKVAERI